MGPSQLKLQWLIMVFFRTTKYVFLGVQVISGLVILLAGIMIGIVGLWMDGPVSSLTRATWGTALLILGLAYSFPVCLACNRTIVRVYFAVTFPLALAVGLYAVKSLIIGDLSSSDIGGAVLALLLFSTAPLNVILWRKPQGSGH